MSGMNNEVLQIVRTKSWIYFEPPRIKTKKQSKPIESQSNKEHQNEHFKQ